MTVHLQRKIRRILMALHIAERPLTGTELVRITCHGVGTVFPALDRLERTGWIERQARPGAAPAYQLTDQGRRCSGLNQPERPRP